MLSAITALLTLSTAVTTVHPPCTLSYVPAPAPGTCVSFRQTGDCSGTGPPQHAGDKPCSATIPCHAGLCPSGYCECANGVHKNPVSCKVGSHPAFTCDAICKAASVADEEETSSSETEAQTTMLQLSNGFAKLVLDVAKPNIVSLVADFLGAGNFSTTHEVLGAKGIRLESQAAGLFQVVKSSSDAVNPTATLTVLSNTSEYVAVKLSGVVDDVATPFAQEEWTLTLRRDERFVTFSTVGATLASNVHNAAAATTPVAVRHASYFNALSVYGFFERGAVQMKDSSKKGSFFGARDGLLRFYALGGGSAIDIGVRSCAVDGTKNASRCAATLLSSGNAGYMSGLHEVVFGAIPTENKWSDGAVKGTMEPADGTTWVTSAELSPNDRNFPSSGLTTGKNLPIFDLEAMVTGIYGSSPGCLATFDNEVKDGERVAQIGTTINRPSRGYGGTYNYFDPDNFISLSAMIYSGDTYLQQQARNVLMRSGQFLKVSVLLLFSFDCMTEYFTILMMF